MWEHVVEIKVQLGNKAHTRPARPIYGNHGLKADLKIAADPDRSRIDGAGRLVGVAEIVGNGRGELRLGNEDQVIDEIGELEVFHLGFQIGHAVLERCPIDHHLRNINALRHVIGHSWDLITDLTGDRERPRPTKVIGKLANPWPT